MADGWQLLVHNGLKHYMRDGQSVCGMWRAEWASLPAYKPPEEGEAAPRCRTCRFYLGKEKDDGR